VHAARDGLERLHGLDARVAFREAREREVEQRGRGFRAFDDPCAEDAPRLAKREHRDELSFGTHPAQRERAVERRRHPE